MRIVIISIILLLFSYYSSAQKIYMTGLPGLFHVNIDGSQPELYHPFENVPEGDITSYAGLVKHPNGMIYGVTDNDNVFPEGVLYEYDHENRIIRNVASFEDYGVYNVKGYLMLHSNGKIYGYSHAGPSIGSIYSYDPSTDIFELLYEQGTNSSHTNFAKPNSNVVKDDQGNYYFTTRNAGRWSKGMLVRFDENGNHDAIYPFKGNSSYPGKDLIYSNGHLLLSCDFFIGKFDVNSGQMIDSITALDFGPDLYFNSNLTLHDDGYLYAQMSDGIIRELMMKVDTSDFSYTLTEIGDPNIIGYFSESNLISLGGKLFCSANYGGTNGLGTLASYDPTTQTLDVLHTFDGSDTDSPFDLTALNNKLYGLSSYGIYTYDIGTSTYDFVLNTSGHDELFITFSGELMANDFQGGAYFGGGIFNLDPNTLDATIVKDVGLAEEGSIIDFAEEIAPGKFFISTSDLAKYSYGAMSIYNQTTDQFHVLKDYQLNEVTGFPLGDMFEMNGDIYGVSTGGYMGNVGYLYRFDCEFNYIEAMAHFSTSTGTNPKGGLTMANNGHLYGMTFDGGTSNKGAIYQVDTSDFSITKKFDFTGTFDASKPISRFAKGDNGLLYGLSNGQNGGTLIEYNPVNNTVVQRMAFDSNSGYDPRGSLLHTGSNIFYGLNYISSPTGAGSLFKFDGNTNQVTIVQNLSTSATGGYPISTPIIGYDNSIFYSTQGRISYYDTILDTASVLFLYEDPNNGYFTAKQFMHNGKLHQFVEKPNAPDWTTLFIDDHYGGAPSVYHTISKSDTLGKKVETIVKGSDQKYYITTSNGGDNNLGTILRLDPNTLAVEKLYDIVVTDGVELGFNSPVEVNGKFYYAGGNINMFDPATGINQMIHDFPLSEADGCLGITLGADGLIYGFAISTTTDEFIFSIDPSNNQFTNVYTLNSTSGSRLEKQPITATDGKIYGVTRNGGIYGWGVLFCFDPATLDFQVRHHFSTVQGNNPASRLRQTGNLLVGHNGNSSSNDIIFTYDIVTEDFNIIYGPSSYFHSPYDFILDTDGFSFNGNDDTLTFCEGINQTLAIPYYGNANSYQWYLNGNPVSGATNDTLLLNNFSITDVGTYTLEAITTSGTILSPYILVQMNACDSVYPGDTDADGEVTMADLFYIGTNYSETGPVRTGASILWEAQFADDWSSLLPNGLNAKHADSNGDGIINSQDTLAIVDNFGNTHPMFSPDDILQRSTQQLDLRSGASNYLAGQQMDFFVSLGTLSSIATDVYGLSFDLEMNPVLVETSTFISDFPEDFPGEENSNLIWMDKWNPSSGAANIGMVRTNQVDTSGNGDVYHFTILASLGIVNTTNLTVELSNINVINSDGLYYQVEGTHSINISLSAANDIENFLDYDTYRIYPNPTDSKFILNSMNTSEDFAIITDLTGKKIHSLIVKPGLNEIDLSGYATGIYLLTLNHQTYKLLKK